MRLKEDRNARFNIIEDAHSTAQHKTVEKQSIN